MKFRLIAAQRGRFSVRIMCDVMGVSPAGYYAWHGRPESPRKAANRVLLTEIRRIHTAHRGRYGAPRIHAALRAGGYMAVPHLIPLGLSQVVNSKHTLRNLKSSRIADYLRGIRVSGCKTLSPLLVFPAR
jgi:HTH-like domain